MGERGQQDRSFDHASKSPTNQPAVDNPDVDAQLRRAPVPAPVAKPASGALEHGLGTGRRGVEMLELVRTTLFPAYRRAVDALDPLAALELGRHVVGSIQVAEEGKHELLIAVPDHDYHRFLVSTPGQPDESEQEIAGKFQQLEVVKAELLTQLPAIEAELAMQIGPQMFPGEPVLGSYTPPRLGKDPAAYLASEAGAVVELLAVVRKVRGVSGAQAGTCPLLTTEQAEEIVALVEPWKSRPVNFAFLVRVLSEDSIWQTVSSVRGKSGKALEQTNAGVLAQIQQTGALADVGELDTESLNSLFQIDPSDPSQFEHGAPAIDDDTAMKVFEKLQAAAPDARGPLIRQIDGMRQLGELCDHLPWKYVEAIHDSVAPFDARAAALLEPYYQDKGGGRSMHQIYMDQVDDKLKDDQTIRAFGWFFLDFVHNAFTGGFEHEYSEAYDQHEQGWTTDEKFGTAATKALGKAALIIAISAVTGGVVGEFGEGLAAGLGASKSVAQVIASRTFKAGFGLAGRGGVCGRVVAGSASTLTR